MSSPGTCTTTAVETSAESNRPEAKYFLKWRSYLAKKLLFALVTASSASRKVLASNTLFCGARSSRFRATIPKSTSDSTCSAASERIFWICLSEYNFLQAMPTLASSKFVTMSGSTNDTSNDLMRRRADNSSSHRRLFTRHLSLRRRLRLPDLNSVKNLEQYEVPRRGSRASAMRLRCAAL